MKRAFVNFLLVLVSCFCGIALVELAWHLSKSPVAGPAGKRHDGRYMLFGAEGGSAFRNVGEFFLYRPESVIRSATYYDTSGSMVREYEYEFSTNNLGLVQEEDVVAGKPSALVLGDSFTEGQGAEPWFGKLATLFREKNYQAVNGGLLGTGFKQWILLHDYLKGRSITIEKLIVVFISDDFERNVWNFRPQVLDCLSNYLNCAGDEDFHGMPPDSERHAFLEKLRRFRAGGAAVSKSALANAMPATAQAYRGARQMIGRFREWLDIRLHRFLDPGNVIEDSFGARQIRYFSDRYGKDVIFVHIPYQEELGEGPDASGMAVREAIRDTGAKFFDGFERCGLAASDYYFNDGHPNAAGYAKIAACVREAAKEIM